MKRVQKNKKNKQVPKLKGIPKKIFFQGGPEISEGSWGSHDIQIWIQNVIFPVFYSVYGMAKVR